MSLPTIAGVQSRIRTIADHPAFMIIREMADTLGLDVASLSRAFRRNKEKFPAGYFFALTPDEYMKQLGQSVTTAGGQSGHNVQTAERARTDLQQFAFTEKGALFLLRFVTGDQAESAFAMLIDAFADRREAELERYRFAIFKDRQTYIGKNSMRQAIADAAAERWTFGQLTACYPNWSKPRLGAEIEEMRVRGYIPQHALFVPPYVLEKRRNERVLLDIHANDDRQMRMELEG